MLCCLVLCIFKREAGSASRALARPLEVDCLSATRPPSRYEGDDMEFELKGISCAVSSSSLVPAACAPLNCSERAGWSGKCRAACDVVGLVVDSTALVSGMGMAVPHLNAALLGPLLACTRWPTRCGAS